jgi:phosphohistidine phosphatase
MNGRKLVVKQVMKTLYILRHAKSSWSQPDLADFDRPLNERGNEAAPFMGELMATRGYHPSIIISSPAARARRTADLVKASGGLEADLLFDDRIYEASPQSLRQVVSELDDRHSSAMLVGHNPGMEGFIRYLSGDVEAMPTAALAILTLNIDSWKSVNDSCGTLQAVHRPKDELKEKKASPGQ